VRGCVRLGSFLALTLTLNPSQGLGFGEFFTEGREGSEGGARNIEQGMSNFEGGGLWAVSGGL